MRELIKTHSILLITGTLFSALSLGAIISFTSPESAGILTYFFLYTSIFLTAVGGFTALGLMLRQKFATELYQVNFNHSIRQGILLALLILISLLLKAHGLFLWWIEASLILFLISVEAFFNL